MNSIREFLGANKSRVIRVIVLLVVFFLVITYINGRSIYKQKTKMLQEQNLMNVKA
jgi:hypothetical protein